MATSPRSTNLCWRILSQLNSSGSRRVKAAASLLHRYIFYHSRVRFMKSFNESLVFIIPALTTFLQIKFHGFDPTKSPFVTHPIRTRVAVSSSVAYYATYAALQRFPLHRYAPHAQLLLVLSGYAAVASLASVHFPDVVSPFLYALFAWLSVAEYSDYIHGALFPPEDDGAGFRAYGRRVISNFMRRVGEVRARPANADAAVVDHV